jgi:aspartate--ammonia ligase
LLSLASDKFLLKKQLGDNIMTQEKKADLVGPGIGDYAELEKVLPQNYTSLLSPKETQKATYEVKNYIEENLCKQLNLMMVTVPLIVDVDSGVNDLLDRDGSRTPIQFHISNDPQPSGNV